MLPAPLVVVGGCRFRTDVFWVNGRVACSIQISLQTPLVTLKIIWINKAQTSYWLMDKRRDRTHKWKLQKEIQRQCDRWAQKKRVLSSELKMSWNFMDVGGWLTGCLHLCVRVSVCIIVRWDNLVCIRRVFWIKMERMWRSGRFNFHDAIHITSANTYFTY